MVSPEIQTFSLAIPILHFADIDHTFPSFFQSLRLQSFQFGLIFPWFSLRRDNTRQDLFSGCDSIFFGSLSVSPHTIQCSADYYVVSRNFINCVFVSVAYSMGWMWSLVMVYCRYRLRGQYCLLRRCRLRCRYHLDYDVASVKPFVLLYHILNPVGWNALFSAMYSNYGCSRLDLLRCIRVCLLQQQFTKRIIVIK